MGRINVLDDQMVNRIAAGEVVERPASVVKELIENSLDAGATTVDVHVVSGGKRLIRVTDDGAGMDRDDVLLALERHATSKLANASDLEAIRSLGFRGEALPSIAAVARFLLASAPEDGSGTEIEVRGGRILAVREVGRARGTTVQASSLFFNVPARRKFLRTESTELSHIVRIVGRYAVSNPSVRFRLEHGGRRLLDASPAEELSERVRQVYGRGFAGRLLPFSLRRGGVDVHGLAGRPVDGFPRRDQQHLFVNGRLVQDRVLAHGVQEAYGNTMPRGRFPAVVLFVDLDAARVDVNVHPQKTEVRFVRSAEVHDLVRDAVAAALAQDGAVPTHGELRPSSRADAPADSVPASALRYLESHRAPGTIPAAEPRPGARASGFIAAGSRGGESSAALLEGEEGAEARRELSPLAQLRDSYIVAEDRDGLVLVDQHAAHERVLFERYLRAAEENRVEVQKLLFPLTIELPAHEALLLEEEADEFGRLGFVLSPFGGNTFRLDGVPAVVRNLEPEPFLREALGEAHRVRSAASGLTELRRRLVTTAACQAAIKINHSLTRDGMQALLDDLSRTANPTTCPHGRPVLFRLSLEEIERTFRRR